MRVIAGELRGRRLLFPPPDTTRPITDRVKQSLFDILVGQLDRPAYDCFAGAGSLGIEALSRGCPKISFFERDRTAINLLRKNLESLGVANRAHIFAGDVFSILAKLTPPPPAKRPGIIFLDPPYHFLQSQAAGLHQLAPHLINHVDPGGLLIFRHDAKQSMDLPGWNRVDRREYGSMTIDLLQQTPSSR